MPATTTLVLTDGPIRQPKANPLFQVLESLGEVRTFGPLRGADLDGWVRGRVADRGGRIDRLALRNLVGTLGSNLRLLSSEIEKLLLYCEGRAIGVDDVALLVGYVKQGNIFALADAFVEGRYREARIILYQLQEDGVQMPQIFDALRRQVRTALQAQDLLDRRVKRADIQKMLGLRLEFQVEKALRQARLYSREGLVALHSGLVEGDLAVKTGRLTDVVALDLLLAQAGQARGR